MTEYSVGDDLWVSFPAGWNARRAEHYTVARITPSGQVVGRDTGGREVRVLANGGIVGGRDGRAITAERAAELKLEAKVRAAWCAIRDAADAAESAARKQDGEALAISLYDLSEANAVRIKLERSADQ